MNSVPLAVGVGVGVDVGARVGSPTVGVGWSWKSNIGKTREMRNNGCWVFMAFSLTFFRILGLALWTVLSHGGFK